MNRRGMIHGRFQPLHNGHLAYLEAAAERCDHLFVGITNPDRRAVRPEPDDPGGIFRSRIPSPTPSGC